MPCWTNQPGQHNLDQIASDNPGAVHIASARRAHELERVVESLENRKEKLAR